MSINEIFLIALAVIGSLGGGGALVWALSSYLGKIWANRMLLEHKLKLDKALEEVKKEHTSEIEKYKNDLEKARGDYHRFSSKKFGIIEETWLALFEIIQELKIYSKNEGNYVEFSTKALDTVVKYSTVIKKNSLYFSDSIRDLLTEYVSLSLKVTTDASDKIKDINDAKELGPIMEEIYKSAMKREEMLDKIRNIFKKELGVDEI